jgi:sugar phosphate isomerase/epimerase
MKRRTFLKSTSGIAAAAIASSLTNSIMAVPKLVPENSKYKKTIGLQLWTVRNQMEQDKQKTLKAISDAGYYQVELGDTNDAAEILPICKDLGLEVTSSFLNWQAVCTPDAKGVPSLGTILEQAQDANLKHLVFGYINKPNRQTADQFKRYAETSNQFGEKCTKAGIQLCYHNHSFEFAPLDNGQTGFGLLMDLLDENHCKFELDVFWAKIGGWDPLETLHKLDGRVSQVHLKDLKNGSKVCFDEGQVPHEAFKELGNGNIDMATVMAVAEKIGVDQCHVEQDQSPDPIVSIGQSIDHLNSL